MIEYERLSSKSEYKRVLGQCKSELNRKQGNQNQGRDPQVMMLFATLLQAFVHVLVVFTLLF
jgi:hypothetical protein